MTRITEILSVKGRLFSTEFLPPKTSNLTELVNKVLKVSEIVDSVSLPELKANPRSVPSHRMNAFYSALKLRDLTGLETMFHLTPRDSNRNAIVGILLAAAESRLNNILVIGGDRYASNEENKISRNVYDISGTTELIKRIRSLEHEIGLDTPDRFCIVVGTDPTVVYSKNRTRLEKEVSKLLERQDAGADAVQTQPIFDTRYFEFMDVARQRGLTIPVLVGVLPLRGKGDCVEVEKRYGITIPSETKMRLRRNGDEVGRKLACELTTNLVNQGVRALHVYPREDCSILISLAQAVHASGDFHE